jgi:hypothetical protein
MKLNSNSIHATITLVKALLSQETSAEVQALHAHFGAAYDEIEVVAEIVVKLLLRLGRVTLETDARSLTPVDVLVETLLNDPRRLSGLER